MLIRHNSAYASDRTINVRNTSDFPSLNGQHTTVLPCARTRKQNQPVNTRDLNLFPALGQEPALPSKSAQKPVANNNRMAAAAVLKKPAEPPRSARVKDTATGSSGSRLPNQARDFPSLDGNQQTANKVKENTTTLTNSAANGPGSWVSKAKTDNGNQEDKKKVKKDMPAIKKKIAEAPKVPGPSDFPNLNKKLEPSKSNLAKLGNKKKTDNVVKKNICVTTENINVSVGNQNGKKSGTAVVPQQASTENNSKKDISKLAVDSNKENNKPKGKPTEQPAPQCNGTEPSSKKNVGANNNIAKTTETKKEFKKKESTLVIEKLNENTAAGDANNPKDKKKRKKNESSDKELTTATRGIIISPQQPQENNSKSKSPAVCNTPKIPPGFENSFHNLGSVVHRAPPGLAASSRPQSTIKAPPGLSRLTDNISSKSYEYVHPVGSTTRNKMLINNLMAALVPAHDEHKIGIDAFEKFKEMSTLFRKHQITAFDFYSYCVEALCPYDFESVFVELVLLLPDIQKQQVRFKFYFY